MTCRVVLCNHTALPGTNLCATHHKQLVKRPAA